MSDEDESSLQELPDSSDSNSDSEDGSGDEELSDKKKKKAQTKSGKKALRAQLDLEK